MKTTNDGGPIAPNMTHTVPVEGHEGVYRRVLMQSDGGLSKREWFAGMALQGYLAGRNNVRDESPHNFEARQAALGCIKYADAMLAALSEKGVGQ